MARKERIDLRVYEDEKEEMEELARSSGLTLSELIRQAVQHYKRILKRIS